MEGKLFIFSAPSGAGKTTIVKYLLDQIPELQFSVSATTRPARIEETDKKDYYFLSNEEFLHRVAKKQFVEFEEVYKGTFYGTLRAEIGRIWAEGKHIIFDLDVQGGMHLKKKFGAQALSVFVKPPSMEVLIKRLTGRATESAEKIAERIEKAEIELSYQDKFDVILLNDDLEVSCARALHLVTDFIKSE